MAISNAGGKVIICPRKPNRAAMFKRIKCDLAKTETHSGNDFRPLVEGAQSDRVDDGYLVRIAPHARQNRSFRVSGVIKVIEIISQHLSVIAKFCPLRVLYYTYEKYSPIFNLSFDEWSNA
ncbi:MAG: hypothetical protein WBQ60_04695 [Asticcacaulis sp.]